MYGLRAELLALILGTSGDIACQLDARRRPGVPGGDFATSTIKDY